MESDSFVVIDSDSDNSKSKAETKSKDSQLPVMKSMHVESTIRNRYARTVVSCKYFNPAECTQQSTFSIVLPDSAFIAEFIMKIEGKQYKAYVKEKEQAKQEYQKAIDIGQAAAHVAVSARDSNKFTVSVNVQAKNNVTFILTYEELLCRKNSKYEMIVNLHPDGYIDDLGVDVYINESKPVIVVEKPALKSGNEITDLVEINEYVLIEKDEDEIVHISFHPTIEQQKKIAKETKGIAGQFVIEYDVERDPSGGEVLVNDGYFVHFFAPTDLEPIPKHIIFILDVSGSMQGTKIKQLREAMKIILDELNPKDYFNIVIFSTDISILDKNYKFEKVSDPQEFKIPPSFEAKAENIKSAQKVIAELRSECSTNIYDALIVGLRLAYKGISHLPKIAGEHDPQPIIVFLTDGQPTASECRPNVILKMVQKRIDPEMKPAIFTLAFGDDADEEFLKKLAMKNSGFLRIIYEAADASLQLQDFYKQISSPLLTNITFKYADHVKAITKHDFDILFDGSEFVVVGKVDNIEDDFVWVEAHTSTEMQTLLPHITCPNPHKKEEYGNLERLWAYMTIKQLLDKKYEKDESEDDEQKNKNKEKKGLTVTEQEALDLALKYSFVTPVTSLVVVRPDGPTSEENLENLRHQINDESEGYRSMISDCSLDLSSNCRFLSSYDSISDSSELSDGQSPFRSFSSNRSPGLIFFIMNPKAKRFSVPSKVSNFISKLTHIGSSDGTIELESILMNCKVEGRQAKIEEIRTYNNPSKKTEEISITVPLFDQKIAVKKLLMISEGQTYESNIYKELTDATQEYEQAVSNNKNAVTLRYEYNGDIIICLNITSKSTITIVCHYELEIKENENRIILNLNRDSNTNKMKVDVHLKTLEAITKVDTPVIRNEEVVVVCKAATIINQTSNNEVFVKFNPTKKEQENIAKHLRSTAKTFSETFSGRFVMNYETETKIQADEEKSNQISTESLYFTAVKG